MSYIFSCAAFAGAVGGLIAGGLVKIESGNMVGWQYLYIVSSASSAGRAGAHNVRLRARSRLSCVPSPCSGFPTTCERPGF